MNGGKYLHERIKIPGESQVNGWIEPAYMAELYVGGWEGGVLMGGHAVGG